MSKCLIVYFSQNNTTTQVAEKIATGFRRAVEARYIFI